LFFNVCCVPHSFKQNDASSKKKAVGGNSALDRVRRAELNEDTGYKNELSLLDRMAAKSVSAEVL
jgi:hypothetical protein